jgi:hypothetical protein
MPSSAATNKRHNFDLIAGLQRTCGMLFPRHNRSITLDRAVAIFDFQVCQEIGN